MEQEKLDRKNNSEAAARTLCESVERLFAEKTPREEGIVVQVERGDQSGYAEGEGSRCALVFHLPDGVQMEGFLQVENTGGNVYEVHAGIATREAAFNLSLPEPGHGSDPKFSDQIWAFFLEEIERTAGVRHLQASTDAL